MEKETKNSLQTDKARWEQECFQPVLKKSHRDLPPSEFPQKPIYAPDDGADGYMESLSFPGEYPFTRGIYPTMYLGRLWTMRQYAGFGSPEETNQRFRYLLEHGQGGLLVAFDLPTQLGLDSDDPRASGEIGRVGVAVDSLADMETIFHGLPLEQASPSLTMNATSNVALAMYLVAAEKEGLERKRITGTTQNDILKEFLARGTYIYPPRPSLRCSVDVFEFCTHHLPRWNFTNICGYHLRESGGTLVQETAFAFADAITYIDACLARGMKIDDFAPKLAFNFNAFADLFHEAAKFRAARRLWAKLMKERYGAKNPESCMWRAGAGSGGSQLTAQQPENNIVRITLQALAGILGGVQSFHTAAYDEALAIPSERSALLALRTQQVLAHESGAADVVDPLGGSYYVEALTDEIEKQVKALMDRIESRGGMLAGIEQGWVVAELARSSWEYQRQVESGQRVIVGVNKYVEDTKTPIMLHAPNPEVAERQLKNLKRIRSERDNGAVKKTLGELEKEARGAGNLIYPMVEAVKVYATIGEICGVLRRVFGEHQAQTGF